MKKTIICILLVLTLAGCFKKVKPLDEEDLKIYLYGRDNFIVDNRLNGEYEIISNVDNVLKVKYSGENCLLKYDAEYTVTNEYKDGKWVITSFVIENNNTQLQDISDELIELVKKTDEKTNSVDGNFKIHQLKIVENKVLFSMTFEDSSSDYNAYFEGTVVSNNNRLTIERIIERISDKSEETVQPTDEENQQDYTGDSKLIYDYYASKDMEVEKVEIVQSSVNRIYANVTVCDLWQYLKEVYQMEVLFERENGGLSPLEEKVIEDKILSRVTGKFVNQDRILIRNEKRSYVILNEDFTFTLYENNLKGFETLEEYYYISYDKLTLRNRELVFTGHNNYETYEFTINSLNELVCQANIITTRKGDKFVKTEE